MTEFEKYLKLEIEQVEKDQKLEDTEYRQGKKYAYYTALNAFKKLSIHGVSKSLNADELIKSLGTPDVDNEYKIKPDKHGKWQIEHKHVGSGEPLEQWLTGKP